MTAVLGILNKHAVAIAADSAATISGPKGRKISNTANKVFKLTQRLPVGLAIYSSGNYMRTPWEIIVSAYRMKNKDKSFEHLNEYAQDFLNFVNTEFPPTTDDEKHTIGYLFNVVWNNIETNALSENGGVTTETVDGLVSVLEKILQKHIVDLQKSRQYDSLTGYTLDMFINQHGATVDSLFQIMMKTRALLIGHIEKSNILLLLEQLIYHLIVCPNKIQESSGLVFVGYGESEYFPSIVSLDVAFAFSGRMRCLLATNDTITKDSDAGIYPFAQHDVIDTIIQGIEPSLENLYMQNSVNAMKQMLEAVMNAIQKRDGALADQIKKMNFGPVIQNLQAANNSIKKRKYIDPLLETVGSFSKEELANMAESMIALTSLKRKMTFDEESVGGPVDVAVISKSDGFIWIRRKHYFDKDLNVEYLINKMKNYGVM